MYDVLSVLNVNSFIEIVLDGCEDFACIFIDDIVIFSKSLEDHIEHVRTVLRKLTDANLRLNFAKCHFGCTTALVLGHLVSGRGRSPEPIKVNTAAQWPRPTSLKQLQAFIGFVNYLRDYIPGFAALMAPLEQLKSVKDISSQWTSSSRVESSFQTVKRILENAPLIAFPREELPFLVATDASKFAVSAVLYQEDGDRTHYIAFASKALNKSQLSYSATKRELLGMVFALQRFRHWLLGKHFTLFTDHKALTFWKTKAVPNPMIIDWLDVLCDYSFDIVHRPGLENVLPDALSRLYPARVFNRHYGGQTDFSLSAASATADSPSADSKSLLSTTVDALLKHPERDLRCYISERFEKKLPPISDRRRILEETHTAGHFGAEQLFRTVWKDGTWWPGMRENCFDVVRSCEPCLRYDIVRSGFHPMQNITASGPNDHWAMDLFGFGVASPRRHTYVLLIVDICSRFIILTNLKDKRTITVARALWQAIAHYGPPKVIQSDQGPEFVSDVVNTMTTLFGTDQRTTHAYNPRANGAAESHVKVVKNVYKKIMGAFTTNFDLYTASVQYCMNFRRLSSLHGSCPADIFFGRASNRLADYSHIEGDATQLSELRPEVLRTMEILHHAIAEKSDSKQAKAARAAHKKRKVIESTLEPGTKVMIRDPRWDKSQLDPTYLGPYTVVSRSGNSYRLVDSGDLLLKRAVPIDQLKIVSFPMKLTAANMIPAQSSVPAAVTSSPDIKVMPPASDVKTIKPKRSKREVTLSNKKARVLLPGCYIVQEILTHRDTATDGREYLIRWQDGPDEHQNTWEPPDNIPANLIEDYLTSLPDGKPPVRRSTRQRRR